MSLIGQAEIGRVINAVIDPDQLALECDGMSRVIHVILSRAGIEHRLVFGRVGLADKEESILHVWNEVDRLIIDYRLRMWFPNIQNVPHGIFAAEENFYGRRDAGDFRYLGHGAACEPVSDHVFDLLIRVGKGEI